MVKLLQTAHVMNNIQIPFSEITGEIRSKISDHNLEPKVPDLEPK